MKSRTCRKLEELSPKSGSLHLGHRPVCRFRHRFQAALSGEALMRITLASIVTSFVMFLALLSSPAHAADPTFYWVCKMLVTIPETAPHTLYVSDINGPLPNHISAGYTSDRMSGAFHAFIAG